MQPQRRDGHRRGALDEQMFHLEAVAHLPRDFLKEIPQIDRANEVGKLAKQLKAHRDAMAKVIDKAESMHDDLEKAAALLTSAGADRMADVRAASDALEVLIADEMWPLPKYREMLFPV